MFLCVAFKLHPACLVLGGDAALRVQAAVGAIGNFPAPLRHHLALALVVVEDALDDVEDAAPFPSSSLPRPMTTLRISAALVLCLI